MKGRTKQNWHHCHGCLIVGMIFVFILLSDFLFVIILHFLVAMANFHRCLEWSFTSTDLLLWRSNKNRCGDLMFWFQWIELCEWNQISSWEEQTDGLRCNLPSICHICRFVFWCENSVLFWNLAEQNADGLFPKCVWKCRWHTNCLYKQLLSVGALDLGRIQYLFFMHLIALSLEITFSNWANLSLTFSSVVC